MKVSFGNYTPYFMGKSKSTDSPVYGRKDILKSESSSLSVPKTLDLSDNETLTNYTKAKIKGLLNSGYYERIFNEADYNECIDNIMSKVQKGDVNSSNVEMLLDLIDDKKLPNNLLELIHSGKISRSVSEDLDKLYYAYADNTSVKDSFVPNFENEDEALDSVAIGDVCQIEGNDNISIKMPDNSMKELFISKDTYLKLFPPVERFIVNQSGIGDCYLLSSLDSLYHNPNTRFKILEMFRQNPDNTVDVTFKGFIRDEDGVIVQKNNDETIHKNVFERISSTTRWCPYELSYTAPWVMALEILEQKIRDEEYEIPAQAAIKHQKKTFEMLLECIEKDEIPSQQYDFKYLEKAKEAGAKSGESILYNNQVYTKEEMELYLDMLKKRLSYGCFS